jgi:hypothetical protein
MSKEILLTIPDDMYSQMQDYAEKMNRPIDTCILDILANSFENEGTILVSNKATPLPDSAVDREKAAYIDLHKTLWQKYPGHHVAIYKGEMVDHDADGLALSKRIYKRYRDQFVLIRQVEQEPDPVLHFRSPRFEASS